MDNHNHSSDTHSMNCPIDDCVVILKVHAHDEDEAALRILMVTQKHLGEDHPNNPPMDQADLLAFVRDNLVEL